MKLLGIKPTPSIEDALALADKVANGMNQINVNGVDVVRLVELLAYHLTEAKHALDEANATLDRNCPR